MSKKTKYLFSVGEDSYFNYLSKIEADKTKLKYMITSEGKLEEDVFSDFCEYFASLHLFQGLLEEIEDTFNEEKKQFFMDETQALKFNVFLESMVLVKERLLYDYNLSLSSH